MAASSATATVQGGGLVTRTVSSLVVQTVSGQSITVPDPTGAMDRAVDAFQVLYELAHPPSVLDAPRKAIGKLTDLYVSVVRPPTNTSIGAALWAVRRAKGLETPAERAAALRKELLSSEENAALESPTGLLIPSKLWPGVRVYQVTLHHGSIPVYDRNRYVGNIAVNPKGEPLPFADDLLAMILFLVHHEKEVVDLADFMPPRELHE